MKTRSMAGVVALAGCFIATSGACGDGNPPSTFEAAPSRAPAAVGADQSAQPVDSAEPGQGEAVAAFTRDEVMNVALALNRGEVAQGELAQKHGTNTDVQTFAKRMVDDHGKTLERLERLVGPHASGAAQARITRDPTASAIQHEDQLIANDLATHEGAAFDLAYMTAQITAHAKALAMIDHVLYPSLTGGHVPAGAPEGQHGTHGTQTVGMDASGPGGAGVGATPGDPLVSELETMRDTVAGHLGEAVWIQKALRSGSRAPAQGTTQQSGPAKRSCQRCPDRSERQSPGPRG